MVNMTLREWFEWAATCIIFFAFFPLSYVESAQRQKKEAIAGKQLGYHVQFNQNPTAYSGIADLAKRVRQEYGNFGD